MDVAKTQDVRELLEKFVKENAKPDKQQQDAVAENQESQKEVESHQKEETDSRVNKEFTEVCELVMSLSFSCMVELLLTYYVVETKSRGERGIIPERGG